MRLAKLLFGLGLFIYFFWAVLSSIPAAWGAHFILKASPNLKLGTVTGTVWRGETANAKITIDGKTIDLGHLSWKLKPAALLSLKACAEINSELLAGDVCRNAMGVNALTDVQVNGIAASILNEAMGAQLGGEATVSLAEFRVTDEGHIHKLDGLVTWKGARVNGGTGWFNLGSFDVALSENGDGGLFADISDSEGEFTVAVRGDIKLREIPKLNGTIHPKANAPQEITLALSAVAEQLEDGGYKIVWPL